MEDWLTPAQVAQLLDIDISTVFRWLSKPVRNRKLRSQLWGGRRRIHRADLDEFLSGAPADRMPANSTAVRPSHDSPQIQPDASAANAELTRILGRVRRRNSRVRAEAEPDADGSA